MIHDYLQFRDRFADALDPAWETIEGLDHRIGEGAVQLWVKGDTALATEWRLMGMGPVLFGIVCVGDLDVLTHDIQPKLEQYVRENGGKAIAFCGREGWGRVMAGHGYKVKQVIALKEIT